MKKRFLCAGLAPALCLALLAGGCQTDGGSSLAASSGAPASASGVESSAPQQADASEITPVSDHYRSLVTDKVNWVLASYQNGTLPEEIVYHSDVNLVLESPPKDTTLPESVTVEEMAFEDEASEMYGQVMWAHLELPEEYLMQVAVAIGDQSVDGPAEPYVFNVHFQDLRGGGTAEAASTGDYDFFTLEADRTYAAGRFDGVQLEGKVYAGDINWNKSGDFVWIWYDDGFFYTYHIAAGGALAQEYPNEQYTFNSLFISQSDEEMLAVNTALLEAFRQALADSGLPA